MLIWRLFLESDEAAVRAREAKQGVRPGVILTLALLAVAASLTGIIAALIQVKGETPFNRILVMGLAALTLVTSWAVLQSLFASHNAHRHFQALNHGEAGFVYPGDPPRSYLDFAYLAICIGSTAQISDCSVPSTRLRNLVTVHSMTAFFYNTAILAMGINILSGLVGH